MRIMAIDYGDARTGVAFSDLTGSIVGRTAVVHERDTARLLASLTKLIAEEGAQALCDIYRAQADQVTLSLRLGGRAGVPGPEDNADITRAVLLPLVNQAQVFYDARGCTGVRMTLRVG